jgi:hypothetical protein
LFDVQIRSGHTLDEVRAGLRAFLSEQGVEPSRV